MSTIQKAVVTPAGGLGLIGRGLSYIPGLALLLGIGYAGKVIARYVPHTEYVLFAIAIGMIISNTMTLPKIFVPGAKTYELWLKTGIVFMGGSLVLQNVAKIGGPGILLVIVEIFVSIVVAHYLAKWFKLKEKLGSLIGVGVGICGVSAIIGASGAIDADEDDQSYAIATILLFGAVMVFLLPLLGHFIGLSDRFFGFWAGVSVDNTAETIATGFAFSDAAGKVATVVKLARNTLMGLVILVMALWYAQRGLTGEVRNKAKFLWDRFPKFVLGFLVVSALATAGFFSPAQIKAMTGLSKWLFMLTFAGVGMATRFSDMKAGFKPFIVGCGVEAAVTLANFVLVMALIGF
ncbi:MAG: YeiH family protein [Bacillota bacterium]